MSLKTAKKKKKRNQLYKEQLASKRVTYKSYIKAIKVILTNKRSNRKQE